MNLLTTKEVCEKLNIQRSTLMGYVRQGLIQPVVLAKNADRRTLRFETAEVERYIESCKREPLRRKIRKMLGV
jgi:excisionase family DNA binding protein